MASISIPNVPVSANELRNAGRAGARVMKMARIIAWLSLATTILAWRSGPTRFDARWVSLPPAMSWDTITKARKAAGRPLWMPFCNVEKDCRFS